MHGRPRHDDECSFIGTVVVLIVCLALASASMWITWRVLYSPLTPDAHTTTTEVYP